MDQTKKKLALLGNGYLSGIVVEAYNMGLLEGYKLTGILGRTKEKTEALAAKAAAEPAAPLRAEGGQAGLCGRSCVCKIH